MCDLQMGNSKYIKDIEIFRGDFLSFTFKFYNSLQVFKQFYLFILHFHILYLVVVKIGVGVVSVV